MNDPSTPSTLSLLLAATLAGCSPPRARSGEAPHPHSIASAPAAPTSPPTRVDPIASESDRPPLLPEARAAWEAQYRRDREALSTVTNLYVTHAREPLPPGFIPPGKRTEWPEHVSYARMFAYDFVDQMYGNCAYRGVVADDGSICPSATYPGAVLSREQTSRVLDILRGGRKPPGDMVAMWCTAFPSHAVVFYDDHNTPVAEMLVSFECANFVPIPRPTRDGILLTDEEAWVLAEACRMHNVGACPAPGQARIDKMPPNEPFSSPTELDRDKIHRALARPHGVPDERRVRDVTKSERSLFCRWIYVGMPLYADTRGKRRDGRTWRFDDNAMCIATPQANMLCDATVGELTACIRSRVDRLHPVPESPSCARSDSCGWVMHVP